MNSHRRTDTRAIDTSGRKRMSGFVAQAEPGSTVIVQHMEAFGGRLHSVRLDDPELWSVSVRVGNIPVVESVRAADLDTPDGRAQLERGPTLSPGVLLGIELTNISREHRRVSGTVVVEAPGEPAPEPWQLPRFMIDVAVPVGADYGSIRSAILARLDQLEASSALITGGGSFGWAAEDGSARVRCVDSMHPVPARQVPAVDYPIAGDIAACGPGCEPGIMGPPRFSALPLRRY